MTDLNLKSFDQLYPIMIRKYSTLIVDENASVIDKINTIISGLNATGKLTNDVVKNWNTVMDWVMNDGLTTDVNNKIDSLVASGTFDSIINEQISYKANQSDLIKTNANVASNLALINTKANQTDLATTNANVLANTNAITGLGNGSPKGAYATLSALQTAYPTGATGVYVVTADGKWYYWNGTAWTAGGIYQSTGIPDSSIALSKLSFTPALGNTTYNIFNKRTVTSGYFRGYSSGILTANSAFFASDYIPVQPNTTYTVNTTVQQGSTQVCFFDTNKVYISGLANANSNILTPSNAVYMVCSAALSLLDTYMVRLGTGLNYAYLDFIQPVIPNSSITGAMIQSKAVIGDNINDNTIPMGKLSFTPSLANPTYNLFNKRTITSGYFRTYNAGTLTANSAFFASDYIPVQPNTTYTVNTTVQQGSTQVCFFDTNKVYISGLANANSNILTPSNAVYMVCSAALSVLSTYMVRQGTGLNYPYLDNFQPIIPPNTINYSMLTTDLSSNFDPFNNPDVILQVDQSYTSATTGWGVTAFNSIVAAHNSITDASITKKYLIKVNSGTYNEFETTWSGADPVPTYRGIIVKDWVSFQGADKMTTILQWDGYAGFTPPYVMTTAEAMQKCIFHVIGVNTKISGFTLNSKNTRYCFHPESAGSANYNQWRLEDCIMIWGDRPNADAPSDAAIGFGISPSESGFIRNVNVQTGTLIGHNNINGNGVAQNYGTLTLENVDMNNNKIAYQTQSSNGETAYDQLYLIDCHDVKVLMLNPANNSNVNRINVRVKVKGTTNPKAYVAASPTNNPNDHYIPAMPNVKTVVSGTNIDINVWSPVGIAADGTAYWFTNTKPMNEFVGFTLNKLSIGEKNKIQTKGLLYFSSATNYNRFDLLLPDFTVTTDPTKAVLQIIELKDSLGFYYAKILNAQ